MDKYSGYCWVKQLKRTDTTTVTNILEEWFDEYGWPDYIRTDGGPQYRAEFSEFCKSNGIKHELSSAYNPESNGLAESAVKSMKLLLIRAKKEKEPVSKALAAWRNTARADGTTPAQLLFGRRQRQRLPLLSEMKQIRTQDTEKKDELYVESLTRRGKGTHKYAELQIGQEVLMQCHLTKRWLSLIHI